MDRFSGFAELYDSNRPTPPTSLGELLVAYSAVPRPHVVDLGSGTGLSTRWAAGWAGSVVGVEPGDDMRSRAEQQPMVGVEYRSGSSSSTGLASGSSDVVLAVQAMHWMEPEPTLAEVSRVLRPGGVFATVDADWPPVTGVVDAEAAWEVLHRRIRVFEARASRDEPAASWARPFDDDDPALIDEDLRDPHRNRAMPGGVRSWSKDEHLSRMRASGHFRFMRELVFDELGFSAGKVGGAERFVALMRSQGSYQTLAKLGMSDDDMGFTEFERSVYDAWTRSASARPMSFSWRVRLGVAPR